MDSHTDLEFQSDQVSDDPPSHDLTFDRAGRGEVDPRGTAARMLAVWEEVLGEQLTVDDSFYDLGGTSLLATRLCVAMRKHDIGGIGPREVFRLQTVAALAAYHDSCGPPAGPSNVT
jgi:hypothetical protein